MTKVVKFFNHTDREKEKLAYHELNITFAPFYLKMAFSL